MRKKALIIATVSDFVLQFEMGNVRILQELGYEVHYASNYHMPFYGRDNSRLDGTGLVRHQVDFVRSPFRVRENWKAFHQLMRLQEQIKFDLVHCHTPMGGALGRLAFGILSKKKEKIIYTAHGFHFYKGAPVKNWLLYYPVEKFLSRWTDVLVTINREDYARAKTFKAKKVCYVPGVGVDTEKFHVCRAGKEEKCRELETPERESGGFLLATQARQELRKRWDIPDAATVLLSVGELNNNKNHRTAIDAFAEARLKNSYYLICGVGPLKESLEAHIRKRGVSGKVRLLGFCDNMPELLHMSDVFLFPSKREGLSVALMEAMASGLPVICSKIRGNVDLIKEKRGGILCSPLKANEFAEAIKSLMNNQEKSKKMGMFNRKSIEKYDVSLIGQRMKKIYESI